MLSTILRGAKGRIDTHKLQATGTRNASKHTESIETIDHGNLQKGERRRTPPDKVQEENCH
jgi:hypothetical protein